MSAAAPVKVKLNAPAADELLGQLQRVFLERSLHPGDIAQAGQLRPRQIAFFLPKLFQPIGFFDGLLLLGVKMLDGVFHPRKLLDGQIQFGLPLPLFELTSRLRRAISRPRRPLGTPRRRFRRRRLAGRAHFARRLFGRSRRALGRQPFQSPGEFFGFLLQPGLLLGQPPPLVFRLFVGRILRVLFHRLMQFGLRFGKSSISAAASRSFFTSRSNS